MSQIIPQASESPGIAHRIPSFIFSTLDRISNFAGNQVPSKDVFSNLLFLRKSELHNETKPYKLNYDPGDALPRTNTTNESCTVSIRDLRERLNQFSYDRNGFTVLDMESKLRPEDFDDLVLVKTVYYREVQALLLDFFGATRVEIMEHMVNRILWLGN